MYLRIDGLTRGDLETVVAVVTLTGARTDAAASKNGAGADGLVVWVPGDQGDLIATITDVAIVDDAITDETLPAPGQWPIVSSLDAVVGGTHFAWGAELEAVDGADHEMADRVAMWTALIDAGARLLVTRYEAEAKRVAMLVSDLLALQASPASPSSTVEH